MLTIICFGFGFGFGFDFYAACVKFLVLFGFQLPKPRPPTKWEKFAQTKGLFLFLSQKRSIFYF